LSWRLAEVVATRAETARTTSITLTLPTWTGHRAGQHVDVRLTAPDGYQAERSYAIASPPEETPHVTLTVERLDGGEVSPYLTEELRVGDKLELRGPLGGSFVWEASMGGPLLLVAGGSGIVPLMAMLRHRAAVGSTVPARLLYAASSYEDIIYRDELAQLARAAPRLEVVQTLVCAHPSGWTGYRRPIDAEMLRDVAWPADQHPLVYICGPTRFVGTAATILGTMGHAPGQVKAEDFGPAEWAARLVAPDTPDRAAQSPWPAPSAAPN
jgi:ferredoxin-NADP reductase